MRLISNKTVNLQLIKPTSDEKFALSDWNKNMELIDAAVKNLQDTDEILTPKSNFDSHTNNNNNPHTVTKSQIGLSNVVNTRQMNGLLTEVGNGNVPIFNENGYTIKDSGFTIEKSVPADANFNDTVYIHPENGIPGIYTKVKVDTNGHVVFGQNPTTLADYGITDAEPLGASNTVLANANKYTDAKINELIDDAPETLDTINEIADAINENKDIVNALNAAIGTKVNRSELDIHTQNSTIHMTANDQTNYNDAFAHISDSTKHITNEERITLKNLGTASTKNVSITGNASINQVVMGNDSRLSDSRSASDVSTWAKASIKPTYTKSEVGLANVENTRQYSPTNPQPSVAKLTTPRTINGVAFDGTANINIETGVTGIKGENEIDYRKDNVNITKANIGLNNVGNFKAVSTVANQGLSDEEKLKARENIGVPTFIFQTEEPTTVPENTIIFVYE